MLLINRPSRLFHSQYSARKNSATDGNQKRRASELRGMWAVLALCLSLPVVQSCTEGTPKQCAEANFAPGSNLAGEGFDVTKMQRKGSFVINTALWKRKDKSCTICTNPHMNGERQKLPLSVVDWRASNKCNMKVSSSLYQSSEELVSSSTSAIENEWSASLNIHAGGNSGSLMSAGTNSKLAEYSMQKTKKDKFSFASQSVSCVFYSYRASNRPARHPEFVRGVRELPKKYDLTFKPRFYKFIDTFGTHYITKVSLGGSVHSVTSIKQCEASLEGLSTDHVKMCLDVEASASVLGRAEANVKSKDCNSEQQKTESKSSFSSRFNDRQTEVTGGHTTEPDLLFSLGKDPNAYKEWIASIPQNPDILSYSLESLHELLPTKDPVRKHLRQAIRDYILERSLWRNCTDPCTAGVKTNPQEPCVCTCHGNPGVTPNCCPSKRGLARVKVIIERAEGLHGDFTTATDAYVKVFNKHNNQIGRTDVIWNNNSPSWKRTFDLGDVVLSDYDKMRLEVWDEDNKWDDDKLGTCEVSITKGMNEKVCSLDHGTLFYKTHVTCGPSLSGPSCSEYVASPMNSHLEKVYVSRNSRPVPPEMLLESGVLMDKLFVFQRNLITNTTL